MNWLDKMLGRHPHAAPPPVIAPEERADLGKAREEHKRLLGRADEAIRTAMEHADTVFGYTGPERRRKPR